MGTGYFFWGYIGRGVALTSHPSCAEVKEGIEALHLLLLWYFMASSHISLPLPLPNITKYSMPLSLKTKGQIS